MFNGKEAILGWLQENKEKIAKATEFDFEIVSVGAEGIIGKLPWLNNLGVIIIPDIEVNNNTLDFVEIFLMGNMGGNYVAAIVIGQEYSDETTKRLIELRKMSLLFSVLQLKEAKEGLILERLLVNP